MALLQTYIQTHRYRFPPWTQVGTKHNQWESIARACHSLCNLTRKALEQRLINKGVLAFNSPAMLWALRAPIAHASRRFSAGSMPLAWCSGRAETLLQCRLVGWGNIGKSHVELIGGW
jgi:hypothetical protein